MEDQQVFASCKTFLQSIYGVKYMKRKCSEMEINSILTLLWISLKESGIDHNEIFTNKEELYQYLRETFRIKTRVSCHSDDEIEPDAEPTVETVETSEPAVEAVETSEPVAETSEPVAETSEPAVEAVETAVEPAIEAVETAVEPTVEAVETAVEPAVEAVETAVEVEPTIAGASRVISSGHGEIEIITAPFISKTNIVRTNHNAHVPRPTQVLDTIQDREPPTRIKELLAIPQPEQKSLAWLRQRQDYITASVFGQACGMKGPVALVYLLLDKISYGEIDPFHGNKATQWGEKFEPLSNDIYCYRMQSQVYEFGMIAHPIGFLGASTDGIAVDPHGRLINLEIKSPYSRHISGIPKSEYWAQMQLQMEVLDLPESHFLECKFMEYDNMVEFWNSFDEPVSDGTDLPRGEQVPPLCHIDELRWEKGIIIEVIDRHNQENDGSPKRDFLTAPINLYQDRDKLASWLGNKLDEIRTSDRWIYIRTSGWALERVSCVYVERDQHWFNDQIPIVKAFWEDVLHYREKKLSLDQIRALKNTLVAKYRKLLNKPAKVPKIPPALKGKGAPQPDGGCDEDDLIALKGLGLGSGFGLFGSTGVMPQKQKQKIKVRSSSSSGLGHGVCMLGSSDEIGPALNPRLSTHLGGVASLPPTKKIRIKKAAKYF